MKYQKLILFFFTIFLIQSASPEEYSFQENHLFSDATNEAYKPIKIKGFKKVRSEHITEVIRDTANLPWITGYRIVRINADLLRSNSAKSIHVELFQNTKLIFDRYQFGQRADFFQWTGKLRTNVSSKKKMSNEELEASKNETLLTIFGSDKYILSLTTTHKKTKYETRSLGGGLYLLTGSDVKRMPKPDFSNDVVIDDDVIIDDAFINDTIIEGAR